MSRETLQQTKFLKQIRQIIVKRLAQLLQKLAEDEPEKFDKVQEIYGTVIKLGAVEDGANREKLAALARFSTTTRNGTSLGDVSDALILSDVETSPDIFSTSRTRSRVRNRSSTLPMSANPSVSSRKVFSSRSSRPVVMKSFC